MPSPYPVAFPRLDARRPHRAARPKARRRHDARRGRRHEGTDEAEILSLLADEKFREHVAYYRLENELPEDERERLLINTAFASLQHLADMGDTKALLFLAYEGNRGRHRKTACAASRPARRPPSRRCVPGTRSMRRLADDARVGALDRGVENPVATELLSDLVAFARSNPDVAAWVLRYAESRLATLGESGAGAGGANKESDRKEAQPP